MPRAIRLRLFQQMPNFRKPSSFLVRESYYLPPYSTVIGMIHAACGFTEYHDMRVSVQGVNASELSDYATMYSFGIKYDSSRHWGRAEDGRGGYDGINRGPKSCHLLTDLKLIIHIIPSEDDFDAVFEGLSMPVSYLSLGRHEDLVRVDEVKEVNIDSFDPYDEDYSLSTLDYNAYVPVSDMKKMPEAVSVYRLPKKFSVDAKTGLRHWDEVVDACFLPKGGTYDSIESLCDRELNIPLSFA